MSGDAPAVPVIEVDDTVTVDGKGVWVVETVYDGGRRYEVSETTNSRGPMCKTTHVTIVTVDGERVAFVRKGNQVDDDCRELFAYLDRKNGAMPSACR